MITVQVETVDSWFKDAISLIYAHWQELGLDTDLKGCINTEKLRALEAQECWATITVRDHGNLIGYLLALVSPHLHYSTSPPMFIVDMYYIKPEYRNGNGAKLWKFSESVAKQRGCIKIYASCKVHKDHSRFFEALGYRMTDYAFAKRINPSDPLRVVLSNARGDLIEGPIGGPMEFEEDR